MTVSIGPYSFDGATGTPTPPLSAAQLTNYAAAAEAFRYKGSAPTGEGSLDAWADLGEAAALARLRDVSGLVGSVITVTYPHGSIVGVAVASTAGEWQARAGTVNGGVLLVRVTFDRSADKQDGFNTRSTVDVQTAAALAGPWTTETGWASFAGSDGLGTYAGEAQAVVAGAGPDPTKLGKWVRMVTKGANPVADPSAIRWVGTIVGARSSARRDPAQGIGWGAETLYRFAGLAHVLGQLYPSQWLEGTKTSTTLPVTFQGSLPAADGNADIGDPLVFNAGGKGDRGVWNTAVAVGGPTVFLHTRADPGTVWTALEAARTCIAHVRRAWPALPLITLNDLGSPILDYVSTWDPRRKSLLGQLAEIISPAAGRTFRLTVDWGASSIVVTPVNLTAAGTAYDLTGPEIADWTCDLDAATQVDAWYLDAGRRSYLQTVDFYWSNEALRGCRGWSDTEETAWDAAAVAAQESLKLAHVGRRFIVAPAWNLAGYAGGGILDQVPYLRTVDGTGQETGELEDGTDFPVGHTAWAVDRTIPLGEGGDWAATYPGPTVANGAPRCGPLVFYRKAGKPWETVHTQLQVSTLDGVAGLELGRTAAEALTIKAKMKTDGYALVATLSFLHPFSWRVSARTSSPRTDAPRVGFTYLPSNAFDRIDAMEFAVVGTDAAGAPIHATEGRRDGGGSLTAIRDNFKAWYTSPDGTAEWRRLDATVITPDPGAVVASIEVTTLTGPPIVTATVAIGSPIARRVQSWDLYNPGVTWSASRIVPALSGDGGAAAVIAARGDAIALVKSPGANG